MSERIATLSRRLSVIRACPETSATGKLLLMGFEITMECLQANTPEEEKAWLIAQASWVTIVKQHIDALREENRQREIAKLERMFVKGDKSDAVH